MDFTDEESAKTILRDELAARLRERNHVNDARVELAIAGLTGQEMARLKALADKPLGYVQGWSANHSIQDALITWPLTRLLEKQVIHLVGEFQEEGYPGYMLTPLGRIVAQAVKTGLRQFDGSASGEEQQEKQEEEGSGAA